jgi:hypothetical protein
VARFKALYRNTSDDTMENLRMYWDDSQNGCVKNTSLNRLPTFSAS